MSKVNSVEEFLERNPRWNRELDQLRNLFLSYNFEEGIKWGSPVYMKDGKNLFGLGSFKNHYAIWLFLGGLLEKNTSLLTNAQEGKTHAMRQIKFDETSQPDLTELSKYVEETLSLHKQGKKFVMTQKKDLILADDLKNKIKEDQKFEEAFKALTPGKQKEYSEYISQAKREETRQSRMEKIIPLIMAGKGLNDKYKNC
jgi:uncharacterized protein YdeI (YjbR/CyaY-like superfamily)